MYILLYNNTITITQFNFNFIGLTRATFTMLFFSLILTGIHAVSGASDARDIYKCSYCVSVADRAMETGESFANSCKAVFPDVCDLFNIDFHVKSGSNSRQVCESYDLCSSLSDESWRNYELGSSLDLRVSKAYGTRGYNNVRLSVISNRTIESEYFTYSKQFQYKWTQFYLNTGIVGVVPGETTSFAIDGEVFEIYTPTQGSGVRGVIIADPCISNEFIVCVYLQKFQMFDHLTGLLNAINEHDDVHFWNVLGDNFYDQTGDLTSSWFNALSKKTKTKVLGSIPGNHDFWVNASPQLWTKKDQLGNGFMQFYGQDVAASEVNPAIPYDFSKDPNSADTNAQNFPEASNFFYYNQIGNIGFMGYSGAHEYADMVSYFEEACTWASNIPSIESFLILGHWNNGGDGCDSDMTVPEVYSSIAALPACASVAPKMKYFLGHKHCNIIVEPNVGFMVGGMGMSDATSCGGSFGVPVVDTTNGQFRVFFFPVNQANEFDNYDAILSCITDNGVSGCYHLATEWTAASIV